MVMRKKTYNEIMERLDKLEKDLASVSAAVSDNKKSAEDRIVDAAKKIEELADTIANLTNEGEILTPQEIFRQYLYGKQEDDKK